MKALRFNGIVSLSHDAPVPVRDGEALVQVLCAGICNTDLEIAKGYSNFRGTLGHEFVGRVVQSPDETLVERRVVGEINVGCGSCPLCAVGDPRHCADRTVLGIKGRDGAFAEYLSLPTRNLIEVPDKLTNEEAVFVEPLAAACQVLDQITVTSSSRVAVLGDGKLAQLIVRVLSTTGCDLTLIGRHRWKLDMASATGIDRVLVDSETTAGEVLAELGREKFDVVVEATGSPAGLPMATGLTRPQGTVVLKSTHQGLTTLDTSMVVVNELTVLGSRCGRFQRALELLTDALVDVAPLVSVRLPFEESYRAFETAADPSSLKVLLTMQ